MQQATDWNVDTAAVLPMGAFPCSAAYTYVSNVEATLCSELGTPCVT